MHKPLLLLIFLFLNNVLAQAQQTEIYVNKVWTLQGNREFYVPLHFKDSIEINNPFEFLKSKTDSTIVSTTYQSRKRLPTEIANKYFDLDIIQNIAIYTTNYDLVTKAKFERVEFFEDMIDGMFIAVFSAPTTSNLQLEEIDLFATSANAIPYFHNIKSEQISKKSWDEKIKKRVFFNQDNLLTIKHYEIKLDGSDKLSILSIQDPETSEPASYLFSQNGSALDNLVELHEKYVIWDITPIPVSISSKPVLLVEIVIPETDFTGYKLAIFNGQNYVLQENMTLKL